MERSDGKEGVANMDGKYMERGRWRQIWMDNIGHEVHSPLDMRRGTYMQQAKGRKRHSNEEKKRKEKGRHRKLTVCTKEGENLTRSSLLDRNEGRVPSSPLVVV